MNNILIMGLGKFTLFLTPNEKTTRRWFIESWWPGAQSNQG